mgnify:CR=1 FL=1
MRRLTKKLYKNQYVLKDMGEFPLCVFLYSKQFRKERKLINKLGKIEDKMEEIAWDYGILGYYHI